LFSWQSKEDIHQNRFEQKQTASYLVFAVEFIKRAFVRTAFIDFKRISVTLPANLEEWECVIFLVSFDICVQSCCVSSLVFSVECPKKKIEQKDLMAVNHINTGIF